MNTKSLLLLLFAVASCVLASRNSDLLRARRAFARDVTDLSLGHDSYSHSFGLRSKSDNCRCNGLRGGLFSFLQKGCDCSIQRKNPEHAIQMQKMSKIVSSAFKSPKADINLTLKNKIGLTAPHTNNIQRNNGKLPSQAGMSA